MSKKVIVVLANGFEEVEAITPIDYLRRAGIELTSAAIEAKGKDPVVTGSHGIGITADTTLESLIAEKKLAPSEWDAVVVPGGLPGSDNIAASKGACAFIKEMAEAGKLVCAICAAPARVLSPLGILKGKEFTCYPSEEKKVLDPASASAGAVWKEDRVVFDGNIITSRGAGTAGEFACAVVSKLLSKQDAENLADKVLLSV